MRTYALYVAKRLVQFVLVVFIGISLTFFITHLTPIDPVEQMIASMTAFGDTSPEAVLRMREALAGALWSGGQPHRSVLSPTGVAS